MILFYSVPQKKEVETAKSDKDKVETDLTELEGTFKNLKARYDKVKILNDQNEYGRKRREEVPTSFDMIKNPKSTTWYKRREETEEALRYIHGGLDGAIFGAWDFLVGNISDDTLLDKLISSYKRGRYLQGIFGKAIKDYNKSENAIKKAVAIKYQHFLSRRNTCLYVKHRTLYFIQIKNSGYQEISSV